MIGFLAIPQLRREWSAGGDISSGADDRVYIVQNFEPPGSTGECGASAIVPAVSNAIFAATGKRLRRMPVDSAPSAKTALVNPSKAGSCLGANRVVCPRSQKSKVIVGSKR